jgi:hypothetical protein
MRSSGSPPRPPTRALPRPHSTYTHHHPHSHCRAHGGYLSVEGARELPPCPPPQLPPGVVRVLGAAAGGGSGAGGNGGARPSADRSTDWPSPTASTG